jgi:hypothetical protein
VAAMSGVTRLRGNRRLGLLVFQFEVSSHGVEHTCINPVPPARQ